MIVDIDTKCNIGNSAYMPFAVCVIRSAISLSFA